MGNSWLVPIREALSSQNNNNNNKTHRQDGVSCQWCYVFPFKISIVSIEHLNFKSKVKGTSLEPSSEKKDKGSWVEEGI